MRIKEIRIERTYFLNSTNSSIFVDDQYICKAIELGWFDNVRNISCIPEGRYPVFLRWSPKFGDHLEVREVPNRSAILFHPANSALSELRGCIAPVSILTGEGLGASSVKAMKRLLGSIAGDPLMDQVAWLTIEPHNIHSSYRKV